MSDFFENELKKISAENIQKYFAKAIQELNGVEYTADIKNIEYSESLLGGAEIRLNLYKTSLIKGGDIVGNG